VTFRSFWAAVFILTLLLVSCTAAGEGDRQLATSTLRPYSPTKTRTPQVQPTTIATQVPLGPTPTPLVHVVQENQTLIGIAILYGVDLEDLLLANPGIDPQFLSVGTELIIPNESGQPVEQLLPTPTPVPLALSPVRCFPTSSDGLWCLLEVTNDSSADVEGVVGLINLLDEAGQMLDRRAAYGPLNRLQAGSHMPLAAFFSSPPEGVQSASAYMLSAVPVNDASSRYRQVDVHILSETPSPDGLSLRLRGELDTEAGESETEVELRLLLIAIDQHGTMIGFRIWEPESPALLGDSVSFDCTVFSFGAAIDDFEVMAEARIIS
jgi:LysM repeat protein